MTQQRRVSRTELVREIVEMARLSRDSTTPDYFSRAQLLELRRIISTANTQTVKRITANVATRKSRR